MFYKSSLIMLGACLCLAACQTDNASNPQPTGVWGTTAPTTPAPQPWRSSVRTNTASTGTLLAGWAGGDVTGALDDDDNIKEQQAENRAYTASIGQKVTWNNADTGASGTITPTGDGYDSAGAYYRIFQQTLTIGGKLYQGADKASQQPDGAWKITK